jgi:hypothetical protein
LQPDLWNQVLTRPVFENKGLGYQYIQNKALREQGTGYREQTDSALVPIPKCKVAELKLTGISGKNNDQRSSVAHPVSQRKAK